MDVLAAVLQGIACLAFAGALCQPAFGRTAAVIGLLAAAFCSVHAALGPAVRELVCAHTFVAYEGASLEPRPVHFPTETVHAPGWQWPLPFAAWAMLWALVCWRRREIDNVWLPPLLFGWTAIAAWLGMQKLAAPELVVQPVGLDRLLWPAGLALALGLASTTKRLFVLVLQISLATTALRLPAALFSKFASDNRLGTSLDVSSITEIVHPLTRLQFEPRLQGGDSEQQFWLIWAEHVFAYPAFHTLSVTGFAFAVWLMHRHSDRPSAA